jgi:hypothetical protein
MTCLSRTPDSLTHHLRSAVRSTRGGDVLVFFAEISKLEEFQTHRNEVLESVVISLSPAFGQQHLDGARKQVHFLSCCQRVHRASLDCGVANNTLCLFAIPHPPNFVFCLKVSFGSHDGT